MVKLIDLCAWQQVCNQWDLYAWTWVHGNKWTCIHGYKHGLGSMPNHMLQTSHVWLLKSNKSHHASMVTKGTTCDAWFQNKRQHGKHGYKKVQHGYFVHVLELHDMWSYKAIQEAYKYHGMPSFSSLQEPSKEVLKENPHTNQPTTNPPLPLSKPWQTPRPPPSLS